MIVTIALLNAHAAPATVLEHTLEVKVDYRRKLTTSQTWVVRIDDPAAVVAGLAAPPGLDGAEDGGALVLEDLFVVPENVAKGTVFTLTATGAGSRGSHSGVFAGAVGLPIEKATVTISGPSNQPLTVWADPGADPNWSTVRGKTAVLTWTDVPEDEDALAVFSTWKDWDAAGVALQTAVDERLADKNALGRELGQNLKSSNLTELVRRVMNAIKVEEGMVTGWSEARPAQEMASARYGSPAERGLVLLSVLKLAGYEVTPALYRPVEDGPFPITVPGPALLSYPLVIAKNTAGKVYYLDPANDALGADGVPAALAGATLWVPGDLPRRFDAGGTSAGSVQLTTSANIERDGGVSWSTEVAATGAATEAFRTLLRSLDDAGKVKALERLVRVSRPNIERIAIDAKGTADPYRTLVIRVSGKDPAVFTPYGGGTSGVLKPSLGPAMASWLPPNIVVTETLDIGAPDGQALLATSPISGGASPDALVERTVRKHGPRVKMTVRSVKPYPRAVAERDDRASQFLAEQATEGVRVLFAPLASGKSAKALAAASEGDDAPALQALLWWSADNDKKARATLKKALKGGAELIKPFRRWAVAGDERPWSALHDLTEDFDVRLQVLEAASGHGNEAWAARLAPALLGAGPDEEGAEEEGIEGAGLTGEGRAARVWLLVSRIERDAGTFDKLAAADPGELAATIAEERAIWQLEQQRALDLTGVPEDTPERRALHLIERSHMLATSALLEQTDALLAEAPLSSAVALRLSEALARANVLEEAAELALTGARLDPSNARAWAHCAEIAVLAGRLPLALDAVYQASELEPENSVYARRLHALATLAIDEELEAVARERSGGEKLKTWPPDLEDLLGIADASELLAVLQFHDAAVLQNPSTLGLRAQLRTDAGMLDAAARDSITLHAKHGETEGPALAFAATVGRVYGHGTLGLLDTATDPVARLTRMEYRLITGSSDPRIDARALKDQPRAADVLRAAGDPTSLVAETEGWPELTSARPRAPKGYRMNAILSGPAGVVGFSHSDRQLAVLHVNGETDLLPPPLSVFYTLQEPPIVDAEGVVVSKLSDGYLPLYAARKSSEGTTLWGIGFTAQAAERALADW